MTAGIDGNTRQASSRSRTGVTVSTICARARVRPGQAPAWAAARPAAAPAPGAPGARNAHLLGELLDEDERADEDVGGLHVGLEQCVVLRIAQLLQQVADHLHAHLRPASRSTLRPEARRQRRQADGAAGGRARRALSLVALIFLTAAPSADWYCASSTT